MLSAPPQGFASRQLYWDHKSARNPLRIPTILPLKCSWQDSTSVNPRNTCTNWERPRILQQAVSEGRLEQVNLLLNAGVNVNCKDKETGQTALIRTAFLENEKLRKRAAKMLLKYGAKVKRTDNLGRTAFSWACRTGREDLVRLFLSDPEYEADLGSVDHEGNTNLMLASMSGNANVVRFVVQAFRRNRFDVNRRNARGESALTLAYRRSFFECAQIVLSEGNATPVVSEMNLTRQNSLSPRGPDPRTPHSSQRQKTCNLPKLFGLYTVQLTNSYRKRRVRIPIVRFSFDKD